MYAGLRVYDLSSRRLAIFALSHCVYRQDNVDVMQIETR